MSCCHLIKKCTACQSHWKSDFRWHRFEKRPYSLALAWGARGLKSLKRFWNTLWPSEAVSIYCLWCFFFLVSWSRAYSLCGLSLYTSIPCEQRLHFRGMRWRAKSSLCQQLPLPTTVQFSIVHAQNSSRDSQATGSSNLREFRGNQNCENYLRTTLLELLFCFSALPVWF